MERNANYALVGITSIVLLVGLIAFSLWLAAFKVGKAYDTYDIVFKGPVRGLSEGGEVHFNGIKVGEVTKISLGTLDPTLVIARTKVESDIPIRVDSYAMLEPQGITGLNYVLITAGTPSLQLLKEALPTEKVRRIRSEPSALSDLLDGGSSVLARADEALHRINQLLSDDNIKRISSTLDDLQVVAAEMREHKSVIAEAKNAVVSADKAAQQISALLDGDGRRSVARLGDAATKLDNMMNNLEGPINDFAITGLPQVMSAIASLQQAADNLDRTLDEVQQNPQGLVGRPPAREIEVKP
jgi:phospholipid/cholesterol/gamma-HCH transport system substrate-binding protein